MRLTRISLTHIKLAMAWRTPDYEKPAFFAPMHFLTLYIMYSIPLTRVLTNTDQNNDALLSTERRSSTQREAANALSQTAPWNQSLEAEESSNADERVEVAANWITQQLKQACQNGCPLPHHPCFKILRCIFTCTFCS